jgi:hypothetical protein
MVRRAGPAHLIWRSRIRRGCRAPLGVVTALALVGPMLEACSQSAWGLGFRRLAADTSVFASDGTRYVGWQTRPAQGLPIFVLDTQSERVHEVAPPTSCGLEGEEQSDGPHAEAAHGRFLLSCGAMLNARTGAVTYLPSGPTGSDWSRIGARYVEGVAHKGRCRHTHVEERHHDPCLAVYDIVTRAIRDRPFSEPADLDRPGAPAVCDTLRAKVVKLRESNPASAFSYSDGVLVEGTAIGEAPVTRVRLSRCHGRATVLHSRPEPHNFDVRGGVLSWDNGHAGSAWTSEFEGEDIRHGAISAYFLLGGRRQSWRLPPLPLFETNEAFTKKIQLTTGVLGYSTHTRYSVFWIAASTVIPNRAGWSVATSSVYAAPLSH